ncbi:MAG: NAD(P)-binding protein [Acidobacteriaceae bacterium]|jgi:NADPH-dependent glutamate synthase beta subunit-like oxidoreductase|nr:NAD(P)-binding protein [Acidobacteriaceae bacterium]
MDRPTRDLTPVVALHDSGTGPYRVRRPIYLDLLPPCNNACPAGENIQGWLALAQAGNYRAAWELLVSDNPLPATTGRVCYHPCESGCNRGHLDAAVSIHAVERFLGDMAKAEAWAYPPCAPSSGKRVLIVGAGPSGLSAAYHLTRLGHQVEIHEAGPVAGGMLQFGIPAYRLPRAELAAEVARIERMGVTIVLNHPVTDVLAERDAGTFDAVFVAIGAHVAQHVDIPAREAAHVLDAVSLLRDMGTGETPKLGRRVVIYGGGNTAMDAARTARRLGAQEAMIVYRRDREHMSAHSFEADEAIEEGVRIKWLTTIREIVGPTLTVERMVLDEQGRPQPTGEFETLEADSVVLALGQVSDSAFLRNVPNVVVKPDSVVEVDARMMTGHPGLFAGGDLVPSERTVTVAIGHGKLAARNIDAWLRGEMHDVPPRPEVVSFDMLHLPVFTDVDVSQQQRLADSTRLTGFEEVTAGLSEPAARHEARRCLSCGVCFECDNCLAACPEQAIEKVGAGQGYRINPARCTGCAACFEQCPCHAMEMIPESNVVVAAR